MLEKSVKITWKKKFEEMKENPEKSRKKRAEEAIFKIVKKP